MVCLWAAVYGLFKSGAQVMFVSQMLEVVI